MLIFGRNAEFATDEMLNREINDLRDQRLMTESVDEFPVYVRFAPATHDDEWNLKLAVVALNTDESVLWTSPAIAPDGMR